MPNPQKPLPPEWVSRLGKDSDTHIAQATGLHRNRVARERRARGIPAPVRRHMVSQVDWDEWAWLLGSAPDAVVAEIIGGTSPSAVRQHRVRRGIPSCGWKRPEGTLACRVCGKSTAKRKHDQQTCPACRDELKRHLNQKAWRRKNERQRRNAFAASLASLRGAGDHERPVGNDGG